MERRGRRYVILLRRMYGCTYYCRRMIVLNGRESIMAAAFTKMNQKEIGDIGWRSRAPKDRGGRGSGVHGGRGRERNLGNQSQEHLLCKFVCLCNLLVRQM